MPEFLNFPIRGQKISMTVEVREHILHKSTPYQTIDIYDTEALGRVLFLDGHVQLATFDEHAYHEALVQIPMLSIANPKRALVVGGGDGGVLRELCKHKELERIDMVEIDQMVIEASREHLPTVNDGAFEDPRVMLNVADAFGFLKQVSEPYDLIVMDITDVYEGEDGALSERLFTDEFHQDCKAALSETGILVTQADNLVFCPYSLEGILMTLEGLFPKVGAYQALVPSFGGFSGFAWGSTQGQVARQFPETSLPLKYLNRTTWELAFSTLSFAPENLLGTMDR